MATSVLHLQKVSQPGETGGCRSNARCSHFPEPAKQFRACALNILAEMEMKTERFLSTGRISIYPLRISKRNYSPSTPPPAHPLFSLSLSHTARHSLDCITIFFFSLTSISLRIRRNRNCRKEQRVGTVSSIFFFSIRFKWTKGRGKI